MRLKCINIVVNDMETMKNFYSMALKAKIDESRDGPDRCEILTDRVIIVLCRSDIPVNPHPDCCGLEFLVEDADAEYERLKSSGVAEIESPVTYSWGFRAVAFKDPEGNNIDFVQKL